MANIFVKWFGGMIPRRGEQLLGKPVRRGGAAKHVHSVEANNLDLDSGELRPLLEPQLETDFPLPGDDAFLAPPADDFSGDTSGSGGNGFPSPGGCTPVAILTPPDPVIYSDPSVVPATTTFNVVVTESLYEGPITYQWYLDGVAQPGEVSDEFIVDNTQFYSSPETVVSPNIPTYSNQTIRVGVVVTNPCGNDSAETYLTIDEDAIEPCASLAFALAAVPAHAWSMDDPRRGATVPSAFNRVSGGTWTLEPNFGVGDPWGGDHDEWVPSTLGFTNFLTCNDDPYYFHNLQTFSPLSNSLEIKGYAPNQKMTGAIFSHVFVGDVTGANAFDGVIDCDEYFTLSSGNAEFNPRVTVQAIHATDSVKFTSSLDTSNPFIDIPWNNAYEAHVITVWVSEGTWVETSPDQWQLTYDYRGWVDDSPAQDFFHSTAIPYGSTTVPTFFDTRWIRFVRGGSGFWLGGAFEQVGDSLGVGAAVQSALWSAIVRNHG